MMLAILLTLAAGLDQPKERPVTKVVKLLEKMQKQLQDEKEADNDLQQKLTCWCTTNDKDKTAAIGIANQQIEGLTSDIEGMNAKIAKLEASIAQLSKEIADNDAALRKAADMRATELEEFNTNESDTQTNTRQAEMQKRTIEERSAEIARLTEEIAAHNADIADTEQEKLKASEQRENENAEFQTTIGEQRATQAILQKAVDRLAQVYRKEGLLQKTDIGAPATPTAGDYKQNAGASGVLTLIEQVIQESKDTEKDAVSSEGEAQASYEEFIKNSNAAIEAAQTQVEEKSERKGASGEEKAETEADLKSTNDVLSQLSDYNANLHGKCDFLLKNFDIRSQARTDELEAMAKAKAILKGSAQSL